LNNPAQIFPKPKDQMDKEETRAQFTTFPALIAAARVTLAKRRKKFITRKGEHQKAVP